MHLKGPLYFGHPVNTYDTALESDLIVTLTKLFPDTPILNPNAPVHQDGYVRYREETGKGMTYFYEEVLPPCGGGVFLTFRDGTWGAGVYGEAKWLADNGRPVYLLTPEGKIYEVTDVNAVPVLSIEETRARIRYPDGSRKAY